MPVWAISLHADRRARTRRIRHPQGADFSGERSGTSPEEKSSEGLSLDEAAAHGRLATIEIAPHTGRLQGQISARSNQSNRSWAAGEQFCATTDKATN